jgi:hypothetical protein
MTIIKVDFRPLAIQIKERNLEAYRDFHWRFTAKVNKYNELIKYYNRKIAYRFNVVLRIEKRYKKICFINKFKKAHLKLFKMWDVFWHIYYLFLKLVVFLYDIGIIVCVYLAYEGYGVLLALFVLMVLSYSYPFKRYNVEDIQIYEKATKTEIGHYRRPTLEEQRKYKIFSKKNKI